MADQEARFAIVVGVDGADGADDLASSLQSLRDQMAADQAAVNQLQTALRRLQASGTASADVMKQLRDQLSAKRASLASAQEGYVKLGGSFGPIAKGAGEASASMGDLLQTLTPAGGLVGGLAGKAKAAIDAVGKSGLAGAVLLASVVILALAAAAAAGVVALVSFAVGAAGAARSSRLLAEASTGSAQGARELGAAVDVAAGKAALGRDKLGEMALAMSRAKLGGAALTSALSAVAVASATMGDAAGSALQGLAVKAQEAGKFIASALDFKGTGVDLSDVAGALATQLGIGFEAAEAAIKAGKVTVEQGLAALDAAVAKKLGGIAKRQLLDLQSQSKRAKENLSGLFADVKIEGFLGGMNQVLSLLDQSTASGRALKTISETALNPLLDAIGSKGSVANNFFRGMVIGALSFTIAVLKVRNAFRDAFGDTAGIDATGAAIQAGVLVFYALAAVVGLVAGLIYLLALPFIVVYDAIVNAAAPLGALGDAFQAAYDWVAGIDFAQLGSDIIQGLIDGVLGGLSGIASAFTSIAEAGMGALDSLMEFGSPSRAMRRRGGWAGQGYVGGVEAEQSNVESAMRDMVSIPTKDEAQSSGGAAAPVAARASASGGGGNTYHFTITNVKDAEQLREPSFLAKLVKAVEGATAAIGAPLPEAT